MKNSKNHQAIFGISGKKLTEKEKDFFISSKPLGIILFARNIETYKQLKELTKSIKLLLPGVKIFMDQEGGRVNRLKEITENDYKAMEHFAEIYPTDKGQAKEAVREHYLKIMTELKELGIDSPCAPVCDILHKGASNVIGDRSLGDNLEQVVALAKEAIKAINEKDGIAIIKHIPGHGRAKVDSHFNLPIIDTKLAELEKTDFKIFKQLANENLWAMTAHIIYTSIDTEQPATLSKKLISYIRDQIGFKGKIVTDDICMKALHGSIRDITKKACEAGCDIILHCNGDLSQMQEVSNVINN